MKHTPGPWTLEYDYSLVMPAKDGNHIVTAGPIGPDESSREEKRANARLIAAAPELLQALQDMLDMTRFQYKEMATYKYAQEIINKATQP
jgi:glycine/D-amino acid oxidase-like deaminating enzyme